MPKNKNAITTLTGLDVQPNIESNNTNVHACYVPSMTIEQRNTIPLLRTGGLVCIPGISIQLGYYTNTGAINWTTWALL